MWPNAFGEPVSVVIRTSLGHLKTEIEKDEQKPVLAEGLEVTGNGTLNPLVVESFCNAIVHARIQNSLFSLILPPDGRQRVRRIFYFKRHLPTRNLDDFQMGIGCWPLGIVYWMRTSVENFTVPETSLTAKSTVPHFLVHE
jgi:hypothetical protein